MSQDELTYIKIPYPPGDDLQFKINAPLCSLSITPGIGNAWATGKYSDPKAVAELSIRNTRSRVELVAVGAFAYRTPPSLLPRMDLSFGRSRPFALVIATGSMKDRLDFGGLPLTSLDIHYGAGDQTLDFSYPNPQEMRFMKLTAGSGQVHVENLINANVAEVRLNGDSTCYRVDFGGEIKQNMLIKIGISVTRVDLYLPSTTPIKVTGPKPPRGDFSPSGKAFCNPPALEKKEPLLTIANLYASLNIHPTEEA